MATGAVTDLPEGFVLDELPEGFTLDSTPAAPAKPLRPELEKRVAQIMEIPGKDRRVTREEAVQQAEQEEVATSQREQRESGVMGMLRKALGTAEVVMSSLSAPVGFLAGLGKGGMQLAHGAEAKLRTGDASHIEDPKKVFEDTQKAFTYEPRTQEGKDIAAGPVMREINNAMTAMGPTGPVALNPRAVVGGAAPAARAVGDVRRAATDKVTSKVADVLTPELDPKTVSLARKADDAGLPLRPDMLSGNKFVRMAGEAAENVPLSGSKKKARQAEFNKNVVRLIDEESAADKLTPEIFDGAMTKAGEQIGEVMARTETPHATFGDLNKVARRETPDVQQVIKTYADDLKTIADEHGGVVPGDRLRKLRTEAQAQARGTGNGDLRRTLYEFVNKLDEAFSEVAPDGDIPLLADARRRYAIGTQLEPLVAKTTNGDISPAALMARATADKAGKRRMARGKGGDMGDLARIGQQFIKEQMSSGTAERNLVYRAMTDAATAAKIGAAYLPAAAYNLLGPRIARKMIEAAERRQARPDAPDAPEGPAPLALADEGPLPPTDRGAPPANPLGDTVPDWQTSPGARADGAALEVVPAEGLVRAVDEPAPDRAGPRVRRNPGSEIPAVPGRPDLPDTMVAGNPAEVAGDAATGAAMLTPEAQLAQRIQRTDRNAALAEMERAEAVPAGEAMEIVPQDVKPAGSPKVTELAPEKLPVGEATEIKPEVAKPAGTPEPTDARLAEVERLMGESNSDVVRTALEKRRAAIKKELADEAAAAKRRDDAAELRRTAALTEDADIKASLFAEAEKLEKADKVPVGKTAEGQPEIKAETPAKIPKGKVVEGQPEIKVDKPEKLPTPDVIEGGDLADLDLPRIDAAYLDHQQRAQAKAQPAPTPAVLERGRRQTRAAIEKGREDGSLGKDEADLALWALDKNPNLGRGLRVEMATNAVEDNARAVYNTVERVVKAFTNKESDPQRAVHEILHHSERMMPPEVQRGIRREWRAAVEAEIKKSKPEVAEALRTVMKGITGGKEEFEAMKKAFKDGVLDREQHYHLANPSEFWAVNGARILQERYTGRNSWRAAAIQWLKEFTEKAKGTLGLRSDAPVLKALEKVLSPENKGVDRSPDVLKTGEAKEMLADQLTKPSKEERRAKYRAATRPPTKEK